MTRSQVPKPMTLVTPKKRVDASLLPPALRQRTRLTKDQKDRPLPQLPLYQLKPHQPKPRAKKAQTIPPLEPDVPKKRTSARKAKTQSPAPLSLASPLEVH